MRFAFVDSMDEVLRHALVEHPAQWSAQLASG